jgi:hypothetical protein
MDDDSHKTWTWWRLLSAIGVFNLLLWTGSALTLDTSGDYRRWHLVLSGVYTAVCAFRSCFPRIDLERTTLIEHPLSSIALGRSAATVAEVSFATQIALALHELGGRYGFEALQTLAPWVVVALATAQVLCWYGVVTGNHLGHAIEESIWAVTFAVLGVALVGPAMQLDGALQGGLVAAIVACAGYVAFMVTVDVPMYLARWREGGHEQRGIVEGFRDAVVRQVPTQSWAVWKPEVAWLTGYFSGAVWTSLALLWLSGR